MDMEMLLRAVIYGISTSGILFLVSLGISIGFGLMRIVNMEQMVYYTFGAYMTYTIFTVTGSFWLGLACGVILAGFLGFLVERMPRQVMGRSWFNGGHIQRLLNRHRIAHVGLAPAGGLPAEIRSIFDISMPLYRWVIIGIAALVYVLIQNF
jgi:hypothetical protein